MAHCIVTINVLWLFHMVPWVGLQFVIVVFPDHTHLLTKRFFLFSVAYKGSLTVWALYAYFSDSQNAAFELLVRCM